MPQKPNFSWLAIFKKPAYFMSMQTGPAANQTMSNWLAWTGCLELVNIILYLGLLLLLNMLLPNTIADLSIIGALTMSIILLQGGLYWLLKRTQFLTSLSAMTRLRAIRCLYVLNVLLMGLFPAVVTIRLLFGHLPGLGDSLIGIGYYLFGLGEFVHYFWFKINMRPSEMKRMRHRQLIPARFLREYRRAKRAVK
ncbi:MAG: hypothetical protein JXB07_21670 [Anaerolineae bacterium]|nr:hypothetical protein [Anaerolineae bacterium]